MNDYETMLVFRPDIEDEKREALIERLKSVIGEGNQFSVDNWGLRKLAYEINKKKDGFYVLIQFKANADMPKELDRRLRISDSIMRHIIVCKDEQ